MVAFAALLLFAASPSIKAADGHAVPATWTAPARGATTATATPAPAAVLVNDGTHALSDWAPVAARLAKSGIGALVIDIRASKRDPAEAAPDVLGALAWLRARGDVDGARVLLVGAGSPALSALVTAASDAKIAGLALLSAPLKKGEFDGEQAIGVYGERPVFVGVARGDKEAAKAALVYEGTAHGTRQIYIAQNGGSGMGLLLADPDALDALAKWAASAVTVPAKSDAAATAATAAATAATMP